jgi:hypothetical protein
MTDPLYDDVRRCTSPGCKAVGWPVARPGGGLEYRCDADPLKSPQRPADESLQGGLSHDRDREALESAERRLYRSLVLLGLSRAEREDWCREMEIAMPSEDAEAL